MLNASQRRIAPPWAIPKPLAPAAPVSNAHLATNGHASNPSRKSANNMASLSPVLVQATPAESAKPATINTPNVAALSVISGTIRLKHVKTLVLSVRCITATALARKIKLALKLCSVWLFMKNQPARMVGL